MGIRIAIGAIIAVLLGGTGYFAQQSHSTKNQLQKREIELSAEKDNTAKLNLRFKTIEQQMNGLQSRLDKEGTSAKTEIQEMSRQIAEKSASLDQEKAKVQNLEITLKQIQTTLDDERKARAEAEKTNQQNTELAGNRAEEIKRLDTQAKQLSQLITEKNTDIDQEKAKVQNLEITLKQIQTTLDDERKARAEAEKTNQQNTELAGNRAEEIKRLDTQAKQLNQLITEKNTDIKQEKAEIRNLKTTHDIINSSLDNERKVRAEAEKANKQNIEIASKRAEEMSKLITEKNTDIKQEKAEIRNLKTTHDIINSSLDNERKVRAEAEKANKQNIEIASKRAEEMSKLITEKNTDIKQEKAEIRKLKTTHDIINSSLDNERKVRAEAEKANKQNIEIASKRAEEMSKLITEKNTDIKQEKAEIRKLKTTHDIINSSLDNERRMRAEAEKANKESLELATKRAEEIKRLEAQTKEMNQFIAEKNAGLEQEKAKTRKLEIALSRIQASLKSDRKTQALVDKLSKQNLEFAADRAKEIKRLEAQTKEMNQFIAEKNAGLEQEKAKTRKLEIALSRIQASLKSDRKTQALVDKLSKQNLEFAADRAEEIKRLEKVRGILETQVARMDGLIASEQKKAKDRDVTDKRNTTAKVGTEKAQNGELARKRAGEIARLEKTRMVLNTQVQEMSRLIAEKNAGIAREKTKAQNLELALNQIRGTLDAERKTRAKAEKANAQIAEFARNQTKKIESFVKAKELLGAQVQEMSQLIAEKTSVAELIKNKLDQTNLSLSETIKKHTLAIARSKILEKKAREEAERARKLESDLNELNKKLKKQFVSLQQTKDLLRVTIVNSLLFDSGSARLKEKGLEALLSVAEFLQKQKDKIIRVEGHTDNQPIKGNLLDRYPSNWELSFARAVSIVKFLESNNISPARMSATGHSFYRPVASNDTGDGRAKNRRTDILLSNRTPKGAATTP